MKRTLVRRNPAVIRPPRNDPRQGKRDPDYIRALATDIQRRGLRNPPYVIARGTAEEVVVGEHRRLALVLLGIVEADFYLIEGELSEVDLALERLQEAEMHQGFTPQEKAAAVQVMVQNGLSRGQISELTGWSEAEISKLFKIRGDLAPALQADLEGGKLGVSYAYLLACVQDHSRQQELAEKVYAGLLKKESLERKVKELNGKNGKAPARPVRGRTPRGVQVIVPVLDFEALLAELMLLVEVVKKLQKNGLPLASLPALLRQ